MKEKVHLNSERATTAVTCKSNCRRSVDFILKNALIINVVTIVVQSMTF